MIDTKKPPFRDWEGRSMSHRMLHESSWRRNMNVLRRTKRVIQVTFKQQQRMQKKYGFEKHFGWTRLIKIIRAR